MRKVLVILAIALVVIGVATAQDNITPGQTVEGEVTDGAVTYTLTASAGDAFAVYVAAEGFSPDIKVIDSGGWQVRFEFGGDTFANLVFTAPDDGTYTIISQDFTTPVTGSYALTVMPAETITAGEVLSVDVDKLPHAYTFEGTTGTLIAAAITTDGFDGELYLLDPNNRALKSASTYGSSSTAVEYILPEDGTYLLGVSVRSSSRSLTGTFTLELTELNPAIVAYDEPITLEMQGINRDYIAFPGETGDIINVIVENDSTPDITGFPTKFELIGSDGSFIISDSDGGVYNNPSVARIMLPDTGYYLLKIIPDTTDESVSGPVTVTVEDAEMVLLDDGPAIVTLGDRFDRERLRFNAEEGKRYRIIVEPDRTVVSFSVSIGTGFFGGANSFSGSDIDGMIVDFTATKTELTTISISQSNYQAVTTYSVTLEPLD